MSNHALPPTPTFGHRRAPVGVRGGRWSLRTALRGWVERHVVAMDPTDEASRLDRFDGIDARARQSTAASDGSPSSPSRD